MNFRRIMVGIYAPELVVFTSWRQWSSAKLLGDIVKRETPTNIKSLEDNAVDASRPVPINEPQVNAEYRTQFTWTVTHDFFASTGGFVSRLTRTS